MSSMIGIWDEMGSFVCLLPKVVYRVPIAEGFRMVEHLGAVKPRRDGRWNWWRWQSRFHRWKTGQGVADSQEAAQKKVLEGWE
jgi:hypothetical protein